MLKFIRGKGQQPTAERQKLQKDLFAFRKTVQHGFPNKPTAIAWDPSLRLMVIGTASGAIKVFGQPGVEFYGQHATENGESAVTKLITLPNEGRVVSLCDDNTLHLWEINENSLVETKSIPLEGKLKKISAMCMESNGDHLLLGTEGGNIYLLNVKTFTMADTIYQDVVMQNVPENYKINPGAVEAIAERPGHPDTILIGYNRGLMALWNKLTPGAQQTFVSTQQLESVHWVSEERFVSSHNDGSYSFWDTSANGPVEPDSTTLYGPFPCKAISKIVVHPLPNDSELIVFSGGMPRASYGDRHTVTAMTKGKAKHVIFDFTSKVIDFFTLMPRQEDKENVQGPAALIVLAEEEIVAIDLLDPDWKMMALPYLVSLHASAVTCSHHIPYVSDEIWDKIVAAGKEQTQHLYSEREWPIDGGQLLCNKPADASTKKYHELLLTGHEDGTVRFWDASSVTLTSIYKFNSSIIFSGEHLDVIDRVQDDEVDDEPFRKVGIFDPYSDDPRLAVKKVVMCPVTGTLVVGGTAGHVVVATIGEAATREVPCVNVNIVSDRDSFSWKGHDCLTARSKGIPFATGYQPDLLLQIYPPAAVTALAVQSQWRVLAVGTAHGFCVFDYQRKKNMRSRCTLGPNDFSNTGDTPISRRKSFKKSLRESFRRLRKGRSQRRTNANSPTRNIATEKKKESPSVATSPSVELNAADIKPIERQVEARPIDDAQGSMVRCMYFAKSYIISMQETTPTLWIGTNNGTVYILTISVGEGEKRNEQNSDCTLVKEIQLKHRAPVIAIAILDGNNVPLPEPGEVELGISPAADLNSPHRVVIASEEQFKIFNLPSLKPFCKYKLTAHEGSRVRKTGFAKFSCYIENVGPHEEICLLCLTNLGDCLILSIPELRRQLNAAAIKREDINGISSLTFTKAGEALYLHSSSELQRISLSVTKVTKAHCALNLPPGARAPPEKNEDTITTATIVEGETETENDNQSATPNKNITENGVALSASEEDNSKENTLRPAASTNDINGDEDRQDVNSIGDITIDSVKDHLLNSSLFKNTTSSEELQSRLSGLKMEVTSRTSEISTQNQSLIVKTTTVTSQTSTNGTTNGEIETNEISEGQQVNSTTIEREIRSGTETTTTHATITLPANVEISAADLANLEVTTTTVTTEKSKAPLARPEEVGS